MAEVPAFGAYVRAVKGHAVPRYGTREYLGCARNGREFVWDEGSIIPLTVEYCRAYVRELRDHLANGEIEKCTAEQYAEQLKLQNKASEGTTEESNT